MVIFIIFLCLICIFILVYINDIIEWLVINNVSNIVITNTDRQIIPEPNNKSSYAIYKSWCSDNDVSSPMDFATPNSLISNLFYGSGSKKKECIPLLDIEGDKIVYNKTVELIQMKNEIVKVLPENDVRTNRIKNNFKEEGLFEVHPYNKDNSTSFTINKGKYTGLCYRNKDMDLSLHDSEVLKFVFLHELSHIASVSIDHTDEFWMNFKWLLHYAYKYNIIKPVNYREYPVYYCGLYLNYNPYYDKRLSLNI